MAASYIFGGDTGETRESLERKREFARRMLEGSTSQMPNTVGEGIAALGMALSGRWGMNAANKEEASKREAASSEYAKNLPFWLQSSMGGTSAPSAPSPSASQPTRSSAPSMAPQPAPQGKEEFISMMMPAALKASERTGVDPRLIIAQAAQETGWGKSAPGNNYFGIKSHGQGGGQNLATHEYVDGKRVNVNANFRQYGGPTESALGYADFLLNNPRYQPMLNAEGLDAQLAALGQSGYATDPNYAQSVGSIARGISLPPEMAGNQAPLAIEAATTGNPHLDAFGADMEQRQRAAQKMKTALTYAPRQDLRDVPLNMSAEDAMQAQADRQLPGNPQDYVRPAANQPGMAPQPSPQPAPAPQSPQQPAFNPLMQRRDQLAQQTGSQQIAQADPNKGFLAAILGGGQGRQPSGGEFPPAPSPDGMDPMRGPQLPFDPAMLELANNPFLPEGQRAVLQSMIEQQMQAADPMRRLEIEIQREKLNDLRSPEPRDLINAGDGRIFDPNSREWITAPDSGAEPPEVETFYDEETGQEYKGQWNPQTRQWDMVGGNKAPSGMSIRTNPDGTFELVQGGKKLTENQSKLTLFRSLQTETQPILLDLESQWNPANLTDAAARSTPIAGNFFQSEEGQMYQAAATAWAEGALRIATGAAATPEEMERTKKAYFAQPGDTPNTILFKAQMREMYDRSIQRALGEEAEGTLPKPSEFADEVTAAEGGTSEIDRPADVPQELWDAMTPEERALWQ